MTNNFRAAQLEGQWVAVEVRHGMIRSCFSPTFATEPEAELFADFARVWHSAEIDFLERDQLKIAAAVTRFMAPILGVEIADVLSAADILAGFLESAELAGMMRRVAA
jgi:hypothetical protein